LDLIRCCRFPFSTNVERVPTASTPGLVEYMPLRQDSPLQAWIARVDAQPRG
jgi:hypothetical protein